MVRIVCLFLTLAFTPATASLAQTGSIIEFGGGTMGTTYSVKVFLDESTEAESELQDVRLAVDAELRSVNDQMSTYLKSSEISRFNASRSTDWFPISQDFANVLVVGQEVAAKTDGAFDITVGPLVQAWNFGPGPRSAEIPSDQTIEALLGTVGYQRLSVRTEPPAVKKSHPELAIDLSAIAKGHGVDRVVQVMTDAGFSDVFVEVGGEIRVAGSKQGTWWKVGIQTPDAASNQWTVSHSLSTQPGVDDAMATSGDYRNFFEVDGKRYSHTIDPRSGRPVDHDLASVSVVAESCVKADAWATALNVLGADEGLRVAKREGLDVLLISRTGETFTRAGTGTLASYSTGTAAASAEVKAGENAAGSPLVVMAITTVAFASILFAMAVGVIFGRRAISGSCGGLANKTDGDGNVSCGLCSNPADACKELRNRMQNTPDPGSKPTV